MSKTIHFGDEARLQMFTGMEKVAKAVICTMWPKGRNVIFSKWYGAPQVTNDWVTIAKQIDLEDKIESMGAELIKEAASRTNDTAGDGTTTATLLTYAMAKEGLREIRSGINAIELKNGMKKAGDLIVAKLKEMSTPVVDIAQVATISAQDPEVWKIIADAMDKVWNDWVITVEMGNTLGISVDITKGMKYDQWYISPYMVTDLDNYVSKIEDAHILITDKKISSLKDIIPIMEALVSIGKRELVIIADDIDGEALSGIIMNRMKGIFTILGVKWPWFWNRRWAYLEDLAILTGGTVITEEMGMKLTWITIDMLGRSSSVCSTKDSTTIISGCGDKDKIQSRIDELKKEMNIVLGYDKERFAERIAKIAGGVAVIRVGAASEIEMTEKKLRIEDALNATRAAVQEWVVAGWWVALLRCSDVTINHLLWSEIVGANIVIKALSYPLLQIVNNAWGNWEVVASKLIDLQEGTWYDAATDTFVDMMVAGIIDPTKVVRCALENAISVASMFLTTEAIIIDNKKDDNRM